MFQKQLKSVFILFSLLMVLLLVNVGHSEAASPDSPTRISPLNTALGVGAHRAEERLDVTLHSPQASATVGDDFTIIALPDTQHYSDSANFQIFIDQTAWIIAQRANRNIVLVDHLGDIVNDNNDTQWNRAAQALLNLNQNNIAIGIAPGNHDYNSVLVTNNNDLADRYDRNLPATTALATSYGNGIKSYQEHGWYGGYKGGVDSSVTGSYDNRLWKDNYVLFSAGGMDFINIAAEYNFPTDTATWIDAVLDAYPTRRAIISTHQFLEDDDTVSTEGGIPTVLANVLAQHCNVFLILSGHNHSGTTPGEAQRTETNSCGKPVHLRMSDYQDETNGGDGWLRIMTFHPSTDTIDVETYSPTRNSGTGDNKTDSDSQFTLSYDMVSANTTVQVQVGASSDDAEERISNGSIGLMDLTSTDLELIRDSAAPVFDQIVGMRFPNVSVPSGAVIQSAYIEFETDETASESTTLTISGQAADNPTTFTSATSNISSRALTTASAAWSPGAWNAVDVKHQTPDISAVVQEIVNRGGWVSGNAMVYIVKGSGQRVAESWDGEAAAAPRLVIEYNILPTTPPAAPSALSATAVSSSQINLSWTDNADNEDAFEIERSTTGSIGTFTLLTTVSANTTTYANTGLNAESTYCYRVRAANSLGNSAYTPVACATTPEATTETVTFQQGTDGYTGAVDTFIRELTADANTNYSASNVLEWDDNTDEVTLIRFTNIFSSEGGPIPNGATIVSASLRYMTTDLSGTSTAQGDPANVYESLVDWPVTTVTWNNFGGEAGVQADEYVDLIASATADAASTAYTINTTASLQQWSANSTSNLGWIFLPTAADGVTIYSSEAVTPANRPLLTVTYATSPTGWIAYNDSAWASGQRATNVTAYTIPSAGTATGLLKDYVTGTNTPVTTAFTVNGNPTVNIATNGGSETALGTDAYNTFHGIVDMPGVIAYGTTGWWVDVTFTGLDPAKTYAFATSANRAGGYTDRITKFTLSDATTAVNTSSSGVTKTTTTFTNDTAAFNTGENTANGYVASWTGIQPGADGDFKVRAQANTGINAYAFSVFKLQLEIVPFIWDGGGADNNWSTAANWVGDVAPTAADVVRFDATSSDPATANIPAVAGIIIDNGYMGTIDFSSSLAVSGRYRQESGTVIVNPALAFTVNGRFSHNGGILQQTRDVPGGTVNFLKIQTSGGTDVYRGVDLAPSGSLGATTVSVKAVDLVTEFCTSTGGGSTAYAGRCFNITPATSGAAAVTLWALSSEIPGTMTTPRVFHYSSGVWQELTGNPASGTAGIFTWVRGDTTGFSPFLIAQSNGGPTAVTLQSFTADMHGAGWLVVIGLLLMVTATALLMYKFVQQKKVTVNR